MEIYYTRAGCPESTMNGLRTLSVACAYYMIWRCCCSPTHEVKQAVGFHNTTP